MIKDILRKSVESHDDYMLRLAHIATLQTLLRNLTEEAQQMRHMDLPLWYVSDRPTILIREDVDPEVLLWVCKQCYDAQFAPKHPVYSAFYDKRIMIGNRVTPAKAYLKASYLYSTNGENQRHETRNKLITYFQHHLGYGFTSSPLDVNGENSCW